MKKVGAIKSKKTAPVKEEQRITSFFNKLTIQKTSKSSHNNKQDLQSSNSKQSLEDDTCSITNVIERKNSKDGPKKTEIKSTNTKKALNSKVKSINIIENVDADSSDSDFVLDYKEKVKNNIIMAKKTDIKNKDQKSKKENFPAENKMISSVSKDSHLIIDLVPEEQTNNEQNVKKFSATPDKTYLQRDEILLDITKCSNYLDNIIPLQLTISELIHSTPHENIKKRKLEKDSPDIIPPTPQESPLKIIKPKSKLCIENKFPKVNDGTLKELINNDTISPPKKKICSLETQLSPKVNRTTLRSTTSFEISPIKCISPSKTSPQKGEKIIAPISPSKSNLKLKRSLFNDDTKIETITEINEFVDMFNDDWDTEINQLQENIYNLNLETWQYCKIKEISKDQYQNIIIQIQSIENKEETVCILQGVWQYSNLQIDDVINIIAVKCSGDIPYYINNNEGFLVFEPDIMISPTSIVGSQFCKRKGIFSEKFRGFESENKVMIVGTLVHKLLQIVLRNNINKPALIEKTLINILSSDDMIRTSYSSQIPIEEIKNELLQFVPKIVNFIEKYLRNGKNNTKNFNKENWQGKIHSIQDIEENIWSSQLGMKGKIDITVNTHSFGKVFPLELKTGRASMSLEHRGQVILYIMMMAELGYDVSSGLLLYLREDILREVFVSHREKRDLIMLRNEFAYYMKQKPIVVNEYSLRNELKSTIDFDKKVMAELDPFKQLQFAKLPEPINHHSACGKCPYVNICTALLSRDNSYTLSDNHPLKKLSSECLEYLEGTHIDYFIHWTSLLNLESNYKPPVKELKDIWRLPPYKREIRGKSLCYLKIFKRVTEKDDCFLHTFIRATDDDTKHLLLEKDLKNDFVASGLSPGNYVVISTDIRFAIATGFIHNIANDTITVGLERDLNERYLNKVFHLDTYESQQIVNFSSTSLAALLEPTENAKRLRELIIDRKPSIITGDLTKSVVAKGASILRKLNKLQQRAILKALTVKDYLLIKGMPGTGKTATIVALIELLVKLNKTVLITSHTHSAVDNVCLRLIKNNVDIIRLGSESRVHPELKHRTEAVLTANCKTVEEIEEVYNNARVVAVTCLAANHPMLSRRRLDVCIVDESTQVLQCSVIKALLSANSFILIGDPDQLSPVVRNPEAVCRGMNESLFERLDNLNSTITLTLQYRMNQIITDLANSLTYKGELTCGNDSIASAVLNLPEIKNHNEKWILKALDTKLENSVMVIDTGPTWNLDQKDEDNLLTEIQVAPQNVQEDEERKCVNKYEAAIVISLIKSLKEAGVSSACIGVIAPYRAQVCLLKNLVHNIYNNEHSDSIEVNTVDQYQGRDKELIIYSCTRSRDTAKLKNNIGFEILNDKRRLTVGITRAKHKLILIGDFITLNEYSPFKKILDSLKDHQILKLIDDKVDFSWKKIINCLED